jgi:hypothetical protein
VPGSMSILVCGCSLRKVLITACGGEPRVLPRSNADVAANLVLNATFFAGSAGSQRIAPLK